VCIRSSSLTICLLATLLYGGSSAFAQAPQRGRIVVTVTDQTGAVIPRARVTVTGQDEATLTAGPQTAATSPVGVAAIEGLVPGRYTIQAEFPGFETAVVRDVRVRNGDTRRSIMLQIQKREEALTVQREKQAAAVDPQGAAFSTVLTREQIAALPDDPDEMEKALKAMAPPGATIRVDGFTGGKLPPKSQIRSIRLPRMDMIAAQNHGGLNGMLFIDIMTQPGQGPMRGGVDFTMRDDALNARNPFAETKGDEGLQRYGASLSRTIRPNRSSFSLTVQRTAQYDTGNLLAALPDGSTLAEPVRQPTSGFTMNGRFDQAISKDHQLRFSFQRTSFARSNQGIGGFDLPERAYASDTSDNLFRASENGAVGRRFFSESRFQAHWFGNDNRSDLEAPTVRVLDAFTSGGAQQSGGSHAIEFEAATDLDYVRGKHSMRTGVLLEGGRYHSSETSNYLGTFTFSSMQAYLAGAPAAYTRRVGDPDVRYSNLQAGVYLQDDFRVVKSVMLSYGLRYEAQTLVRDQNNFSPRVTATWSPLKNGKTTFRAGWGWFSDWIGTATYRQTLQVDGFRQQEVNILNPGYPDPGVAGTTPPTNRYLLDPALVLPQSMTLNAGVDQQFGSMRVSATYTYRRGANLLRGRNLNGPVAGVRPDPAFSNVVDVESDAGSRAHSLNVGANMLLMNWHRTIFAANYTLTKSQSNTSGPFSLPAVDNTLDLEWGTVAPRHRFGASFSTQILRDLGVSIMARAQSGTPYNITTGIDDNHDGVFGDRPAGVRRNSGLTTGQWDIGARLSYAIGFGQRPQGSGGGQQVMIVMGGGGGGMPPGGFGGGADSKRFRIEFYASAQNVTNHSNYVGFSGVMTSPFFGRPTTVLNPRKIEVGTRFGF
jgi:hypothetical protein